MKPKLIVVLLMVAGAFAALYLLDTRRMQRAKVADAVARRLMPIMPEEVTGLRIQRGEEVIGLERRGVSDAGTPQWWINEPVDWRAQSELVESLLFGLTLARVEQQVDLEDEGVTAADYGLDPPRCHLTVMRATDTVLGLKAGKAAPMTTLAYYQRDGENEALLSFGKLVELLDQPLTEWRDRRLFHLAAQDVDQAEIRLPKGEAYRLERREDRWRVIHGAVRRADGARVESMLERLVEGQAGGFLDQPAVDLSSYGIVDDGTRVALWSGETAHIIQIGFPDPRAERGLFAWREGEPSVMLLPEGYLNEVLRMFRGTLDPRLSQMAPERTVGFGIDVHGTGEGLRMQLREDGWRLTQPADLALEEATAVVLLKTTHQLMAAAFPNSVDEPLDDRRLWMTVTLQARGEQEIGETLKLYDYGPDPLRLYALREGESVPAIYSRAEVDTLVWAMRSLLRQVAP